MGDADDSTIRNTGDSGIGPATAGTRPAVGTNAVLAGHGTGRPDGGSRVRPVPADVSVTAMTSRFAGRTQAVSGRPGGAFEAAVPSPAGALAPGTRRLRKSGATPRSEDRPRTDTPGTITGP